tara:strand:- start:21566 stop:21733 length:168 start_codon:yes stop_codon:yes gene_type:complete
MKISNEELSWLTDQAQKRSESWWPTRAREGELMLELIDNYRTDQINLMVMSRDWD